MNSMTQDEMQHVEAAILQVTSDWAQANCDRDPERMMQMFRNSEELRFSENGAIFPSFQVYQAFVKTFYRTTTDMHLEWKRRDILPISSNAAVMTGVFEYRAVQDSGEIFSGRNAFTGIFLRRSRSWQLVHGHESSGAQDGG